ncbi:inhibin beta chain [Culicoides brevitarsis]|uniref:inhibin beta chain n=1 Tax=Culicoides brevitarsis TaxID=469753 RepID=UPI00307C650F
MTKTSKQVKHLKMYWLMFSSCSYPGPPGPGPGSSQNFDDDNISQRSKSSVKRNLRPVRRQRDNTRYNKHSNRRRSLLDSNLLWIFLGFIWLSSPTLVGCRNDAPLLVSNCDFVRLERSLHRMKAPKITPNSNNNCTYVKLNYYDYVNDSSSNAKTRNMTKNNYYNKNYSDLSSSSSSSSSSFSPNSAELFPANTIEPTRNDNYNYLNAKKDKKQSSQQQIDQKIITEIRLKAIKAQILSKLGLKAKPHVTHTVPRDIVLETINRAAFMYDNNQSNEHQNARNFLVLSADDDTSGRVDHKMTNQFYERQEFEKHHPGYSSQQDATTMESEAYPRQEFPPEQEPEPEDFYAKTSEIIAFAGKGKLLNGQRLLEFSISTTTTDDRTLMHQELRVRMAMLWIKVDLRPGTTPQQKKKFRRLHQHDKKSLTLWVFRLVEPFDNYGGGYLNDKDFDRATDLIALQQIKMSQLGWQKINLTSALGKWYAEGKNRKLRLLIDCSGCGSRVVVHLFNSEQSSSQSENHPFLVVHIVPNIIKRVRRRAFECNGALEGQCCKQRFYVSFKEIGWDDWILAPPGYYANYCRGDCAGIFRTPDTYSSYHTHFIEEYRKAEKLEGMKPCCAPTKFSSMSLIYYGPDEKIIKRDLPKMVVEECGCP